MIKEIIRKILLVIMQKRGYAEFIALFVLKESFKDLFCNKNTTLRQKIWARRRGFLSDKIDLYGLTEENWRDYLSDFDYWKMQPINDECGRWVSDKLIIRYTMHPFKEYLPEYYCQLDSGQVIPLPDAPPDFTGNIEGMLALLQQRKHLALKLVQGAKGRGFYKITCEDGAYRINEKYVQESEMQEFLQHIKGYIVTEYIKAHESIARIYPGSANSLRVQIINGNGCTPLFSSAYIKFGTVKSGVIDNTSAGGLYSYVDLESGSFNEAVLFTDFRKTVFSIHPDTGEIISGILPHWEIIKQKLIEIGHYMPQLKFLGYDIVITRDSFKIIEVNLQPGIGDQCFRPLLMCQGDGGTVTLSSTSAANRDFFNNLKSLRDKG